MTVDSLFFIPRNPPPQPMPPMVWRQTDAAIPAPSAAREKDRDRPSAAAPAAAAPPRWPRLFPGL